MAEAPDRRRLVSGARPRPWWFERLVNLSLIRKAVVGSSLFILLFALGSFTFLFMQGREQFTRSWIVHTYDVLIAANQADSQLLGIRLLLRDGLLQKDATAILRYETAQQAFDSEMERLVALTADNKSQQIRLARVTNEYALFAEAFIEPAVTYLRVGSAAGEPLDDDLLTAGAGHLATLEGLLNEIQAEERDLLQQRMGRLTVNGELTRIAVLGMLIVSLLAAYVGLASVRRVLSEPLEKLTSMIARISAERFDEAIPYQWRRDEVGEFARALVELRDLVDDRRDEDWIKNRLNELMRQTQLADSHEDFAETVLQRLCDWTGAGCGIAYRWNDTIGQLQGCAGFGVPAYTWSRATFRESEGLVGQCARERRIMIASSVPEAHFEVVSGLGTSRPDTLICAPLVSRGEVVGVLEIARLGEFEPVPMRLIEECLDPVALAWQTLGRSLKTQELLTVTQSQAEELQASAEALRIQQEELQSTNEALRTRSTQLEDQGRRLQASEEELRAQADELRVTNETLRDRSAALVQRQTELEAARVEIERRATALERASRYKSEFLANMSHELRTPLNSMLILSKSLADNEEGNLLQEQIESASIVHDAGTNLLQLINDILDLSKVEAGRMQVVFEDVDLKAFAASQERNFRHVAKTRGLSFEVRVEPGLPDSVRTDGARLGQVIANLLSNAFKFTSQGGVTLRIEPAPAERLHLPGLKPGQTVMLSVRDSGIGIAADRIDQIFQPFEQEDSSTSRRYGGTGLGLSIVRGMTALLGGDVQVESRAGQGSTFFVLIPQTLDVDSVRDDTQPPASPVDVGPPTVDVRTATLDETLADRAATVDVSKTQQEPALLVVEDDAAFSAILKNLAQRKQLAVEVASTGRDALRIAAQRPLLGVLLDLGLPDMTGWQVLEQLRSLPATRNVPVHIVSGSTDAAGRSRALGAVGFLAKPATRNAVLEVMQGIIDRGQAHTGDPRRVLIADADADSRAAVRRLLDHERAEIIEADSGAAVEDALAKQSFDCVILELGLPDINGFDLLDQLSAKHSLPPLVIYSARELSADENLRLRQYTESIVIKGERSTERLLDEVSLFLHALGRQDAATAAVVADVQKDIAGKHVLIVDDDMRNIFALSKALRARKLVVTMAQDGHKAISQLEANENVDIVLMDIMMPGMDGYETMRRIRAQPRWRNLPIIAVTAKAMAGDREKCIEAGANDYCAKPIDVEKLVSQIRVWV
jgi:signal transduction histidine kinase/CheY-like chemotaxis protein/CHASE3 domain sensor protein